MKTWKLILIIVVSLFVGEFIQSWVDRDKMEKLKARIYYGPHNIGDIVDETCNLYVLMNDCHCTLDDRRPHEFMREDVTK